MSFSDLLFARGGFLLGMASVLNIGGGGAIYNYALSPEQADMLAMYADWRTVGEDLQGALARAAEHADEHQLSLFDETA